MITFLLLNDIQLPAVCLFIPKLVTMVTFCLKVLILVSIGSGRHTLAITIRTCILLLDRLLLIGSCNIRIFSLMGPTTLGSHHRNTPGSSLLHIFLLFSKDGSHLFNGPLFLRSIITRSNIVKLRRQTPHDQINNII